jgi:hypothetical protein
VHPRDLTKRVVRKRTVAERRARKTMIVVDARFEVFLVCETIFFK